MALAKNNQVKFRIDDHTKMALKRVLENKKIMRCNFFNNAVLLNCLNTQSSKKIGGLNV